MRGRVIAYLFVVALAAYGSYAGTKANDLARKIDNKGDLRACTQDNSTNRQANIRDAALERTARTVVDALRIISEADRPIGDATNRELRQVASDARKISTAFKPSTLRDCDKEFPKP